MLSVWCRLKVSCSAQGSAASYSESGYKLPSYTKDGEFIDQLRGYKLVKKGSAPWN